MSRFSVCLIHQSAKDYLLRKTQDSNPVLEDFRVKEDVANHEIAKRCLDYLQSGALEYQKPVVSWVLQDAYHLRAYPLLSYAALQWPGHARHLASSADVFDLSQPAWKRESAIRTSWLKVYWAWGLEDSYGRMGPPESFSILHLASFLGIFSLVEKVVLWKGWINRTELLYFLNKIDSYKRTALMWAAQCGHEAVVRLLLEKGAHTEIKGRDDETAFLLAADSGHEAIVLLLLEKGTDMKATDSKRETALMMAAKHGYKTMTQLLLEQGADANVQNRDGETALSKAAYWGHEAAMRLLLEHGADVEIQDKDGETGLMKAARWGREAAMRLLLEHGADVMVQNKYGEIALA